MFGKSLAQYAVFQKEVLAALTVVALLRLVISLAGAPVSVARYASMTVVLLLKGYQL